MMSARTYWFQGISLVILLLALASYIPAAWAHPLRAGTLAIQTPSGNQGNAIPAPRDFATEVIGDPWDMNERTDIFFELTRDKGDFNNLSISNGILSGVTANNPPSPGLDPSIWIMFPGYASSQMLGHTGVQYPIDTSRYTRLVFRMYLSNVQPNDFLQILWFSHGDFSQTPLIGWGASNFMETYQGWHVYDIDLTSIGRIDGDTDWTASGIKGFRIDPINESVGVTVKLDWVQLIDPSTCPAYTIQWTADGVGAGDTVALYYDVEPSGANKQCIVEDLPASQCSYDWVPPLAPGEYHIFAKLNGVGEDTSLGPLAINRPPIINITAPSMTSGPDYATVVANNPWDMSGPGDITWMYDIKNFDYTGGILNATTGGNDPQLRLNTPIPIDTNKYRYFTFRMWIEGTQDIGRGWVQRVYFYHKPQDPGVIDDIVVYEGWRTYSLDLQNAVIDPVSHYKWTDGQWTWFRFDVDEMSTFMRFHLDYVKLTANDEADVAFNIRWEVDDPDSEDVTINIYWVPAAQVTSDMPAGKGTLITTIRPDDHTVPSTPANPTQDQPQQSGQHVVYLPLVVNSYVPPCDGEGNCHTWYTSWTDPGPYYIRIVANDGYNETQWYSETPVVIKH